MLPPDRVKELQRFRSALLEAKLAVEGLLAPRLPNPGIDEGGMGSRIIAQVVGPDGTIKQEFARDG